MKNARRFAVMIIVTICTSSGCARLPMPGVTNGEVNTGTPQVSVTPQTPPPSSAAPSVSPTVLGAQASAPSAEANEAAKAMRRDIDMLVSQSEAQQGQEQNYKNQKKEQTLTVERVTQTELKFAGKPQIFKGDYTGQFAVNQKYRYFEDASMGGKRYYNVKDNFGVWITFQYQDPNF